LENLIPNSIYILIGAGVTLVATLYRDWKKERKEEKERLTKEIEILISLFQEIKKGIERSKWYIQLSEENPPKKSFSKIYTPFWDVWIEDLIKISKDYNIIRQLHDIYEKFFFINLNINSKNYGATIGFAKQYISSMDENYDNIARAILNKVKKSKNKFALPEELKDINNLGEMRNDGNGR
jgi:hypothetical protein